MPACAALCASSHITIAARRERSARLSHDYAAVAAAPRAEKKHVAVICAPLYGAECHAAPLPRYAGSSVTLQHAEDRIYANTSNSVITTPLCRALPPSPVIVEDCLRDEQAAYSASVMMPRRQRMLRHRGGT